jgi:hypothetical protein
MGNDATTIEEHESCLPSSLLHSLADETGGKVVLVLGAGCSFEPPTALPMACECAEDAHARLLADGVLHDGECSDKTDLTAVADAVHRKTGKQRELVERLPRQKFKMARANRGHLVAAALLRERVVSCVLTLNFDLAMTHALVEVGGSDVDIVEGPHQHNRMGVATLIYLHRTIDADPESLILRTESLKKEWRGAWEEAVTRKILAGPVTVFAGLGSRAEVLLESIKRIRTAISNRTKVYQVGPDPPGDCDFFVALSIPEEQYLRYGWVDFMDKAALRVVKRVRSDLESACERACENLDVATEFRTIANAFCQYGLVELGRMRARIALEDRRDYLTQVEFQDDWLAVLIIAIARLAEAASCNVQFLDGGVVSLRKGRELNLNLILAHGKGSTPINRVQDKILRLQKYLRTPIHGAETVLVTGCIGSPEPTNTPTSIVIGTTQNDLVRGDNRVRLYDVSDVLGDPESALEGLKSDV